MNFKTLNLSLFLIVAPMLGISQNRMSMEAFVASKSYRIKALFIDASGTQIEKVGMGMVLNGKYLATNYHVVHNDNDRVISIAIIDNSGKSIYADINYKAPKNSYDFSKHIYNPNDRGTDFTILKLKHPIAAVRYKIADKPLEPNDKLYCFGNTNINRTIYPVFNSQYYVLPFPNLEFNFPEIECSVGGITEGFSGTPVFNSQRQLVGMYFGKPHNQIEQLNTFVKFGKITPSNLKIIKASLSKGEYLSYFINIHYLVERYLKGYL